MAKSDTSPSPEDDTDPPPLSISLNRVGTTTPTTPLVVTLKGTASGQAVVVISLSPAEARVILAKVRTPLPCNPRVMGVSVLMARWPRQGPPQRAPVERPASRGAEELPNLEYLPLVVVAYDSLHAHRNLPRWIEISRIDDDSFRSA